MPVAYTVEVPGTTFRRKGSEQGLAATKHSHRRGWVDFFKLGPMAGGWDVEAWAAGGLPTSDTLAIKLVVRKQ
jgi:hypothetical protein